MLRFACIGLSLAALASAASAQTPLAAPVGSKSLDYAAYVEAMRPRMSARTLSGAEKSRMNAAISAWKKSRTEEDLAAVRPFAEAGDVTALRTMFEAYTALRLDRGVRRDASGSLLAPEFGLIPVAALWGLALLREEGIGSPVGPAIDACTSGGKEEAEDGSGYANYDRTIVIREGKVTDYDCGFNLRGTKANISKAYSSSAKVKPKKGPLPFEIIERPVASQQAMDEAKLPKVLEDVRLNKATYTDRQWVQAWAARDPAVKEKFDKVRFEARIYDVERTGKPISQTDEKDLWDYMMATSGRQYSQTQALMHNFDATSSNSKRFRDALASGNFQEREWSSWIAVNNNQTANQWWSVYRGNISGNVPHVDVWCRAGIGAACQQQAGQKAAQDFREKYGDPASLNSGRFAGPSGSIDQQQFAKEKADARAACLAANVNGGANCKD